MLGVDRAGAFGRFRAAMPLPCPLPRPFPFRFRAALLALGLLPLLSACGASGGGGVQSASAAAQPSYTVRKPLSTPVRPAEVHMMPGLEGVIGATSAELVRQFGQARLDVWEGDARKLQFSGSPCILDVYLYPRTRDGEPQATYVEARRSSDGQDVDRAACVAALRKR